jgi:TonB family protein
MPEGSEMLQRLLCKFFFHKEGTSLKDMYKEYLESFEVTKPVEKENEKRYRIMYYVACSSQLEGKYMNMYVLHETVKPGKLFDDKSQWSYNFIYDIKRDAIVGFSDIFIPDRAEKMNTWMADSLICCMTMMTNSIQLDFYKKKNGFPYGKRLTTGYLNYAKTPEVFCEAFKAGIGSNIDWEKKSSGKAMYLDRPKTKRTTIPNRYSGLKVNEKIVDAVPNYATKKTESVSGTKVFDVIEQMPSFKGGTIKIDVFNPETGKTTTVKEKIPGGDEGLMMYLAKTVKYPVTAMEDGIQGRVVCTFVVNTDGSITDVKVTKSVDPSLDKEAVRVIREMPKWSPAYQQGQPVRVRYTVPVTFKLQ